jgi:hypothetical protein
LALHIARFTGEPLVLFNRTRVQRDIRTFMQ